MIIMVRGKRGGRSSSNEPLLGIVEVDGEIDVCVLAPIRR